MSSIGGYFGLELGKAHDEYHCEDVIRLNTARNAFEYILLANNYSKVYIPFFTCDVMLEPLNKLGIKYAFYHIDEQLEPIFNFSSMEENSAFLYTNYFGFKDVYITYLKGICNSLIIDNAQSFYSMPEKDIDTIYSPRKFFGVSDGAYLYSNLKLTTNFDQDYSVDRFKHLLIRIDKSAEQGYAVFSENDKSLENAPIKKMSKLTQGILQSIDYDFSRERRITNYSFLDRHLAGINKLKLDKENKQVPMVYPYWPKHNTGLYEKLLHNNIYCARYWPNVLKWCASDTIEYKLANECLFLPIDQRIEETDLIKILKLILA